jgi:hypothetical protein
MRIYKGIYTPSAGSVTEDVICGFCGSVMNVDRGVVGPTNWAESMSGGAHLYDFFSCPHYQEDWHLRIKELNREADRFVCQELKNMCYEEINTLLLKNGKNRWQFPNIVEVKSPITGKIYKLQNRYQDSGWMNLDEEFSDELDAINRARELAKDAIRVGMTRVVCEGICLIEFPAGG